MDNLAYLNGTSCLNFTRNDFKYVEYQVLSFFASSHRIPQNQFFFYLCFITFFILLNLTDLEAIVERGDQGAEVITLQQQLQKLGYFEGKVTGYFGSQTQEAVREFQRAQGLSADGIVGDRTLSTLTQQPSQSLSSSSSALRNGSRGSSVIALQQKLKQLGYFNGKVTGYFGSQTQQAVQEFQRAKGLSADGIAGNQTLSALMGQSVTTPTPTTSKSLKKGDRGSEVIALQQKLKQLGYFNGKVTGYFGSQTQQAVQEFQRAKGLSADGIAGDQTRSALMGQSVTTPNPATGNGLRKGDRGSEVIALQQRLKQLGYFNGKVTGYFGSQTQKAVQDFQQVKGLSPDGIAGNRTLTLLMKTNFSPSGGTSSGQFLKKGDRGNSVVALQQQLQKLGYFKGKVTGYFGSQTQKAVQDFQRATGLSPDGVAGSKTLSALTQAPSQSSTSSRSFPTPNVSNQQIKEVQRQLQKLGYYNGKIDGSYGSSTRNGVLKFKQNSGGIGRTSLVDNFQGYTSGFGYRHSSISGQRELHRGLDFAAPLGSKIRNWKAGKIIEVSDHTACGTMVRIKSGAFEQTYCHLQGSVKQNAKGRYLSDPQGGITLQQGQSVATGTVIGRIGLTGRTTGPHLHWGLKYKGNWIDPLIVLLN